MIDSQLDYLKSVAWPEVFGIWQANEEKQERWKKIYQARGFSSWKAWRQTYTETLKMPELEWSLYQIKDPISSVPEFIGIRALLS